MIGYSKPSGANTVASGLSGLFQGMQAGQQMNSNDQKMQILQEQVNQQREDKLKLDLNEAMWNIELGGSPAALNTLMQANPDYFGELGPDGVTQIMPNMRRFNNDDIIWEDSMGNQVDGENEDATLSNKTKNMFAGHPLADKLFADSKDYKSLQDQLYMYTDSSGERLYNPEHFELGSSNYAKFKREKLQKEALANANLKKLQLEGTPQSPEKDKETELDMLTRLRAKYLAGELDTKGMNEEQKKKAKLEMSRYNILRAKFNMTKPYAEQLINAPYSTKPLTTSSTPEEISAAPLVQQVESYATKKSWNPSQITENMVNVLKQAEFDTGRSYKGRDNVNTEISALGTVVDLRNDILRGGKTASGMVENAMVDLAKLTSSEDFKVMSKTEQLKFLNTIDMRAKIGNTTNALLKALSGADVTEEQYNRVMGQLIGGDIDDVNLETIVAALGGSAESMYSKLTGDISNISARETPGTKAELARNAFLAYNPDVKAENIAAFNEKLVTQKALEDEVNEQPSNVSTKNNIISTGNQTIDDVAAQSISSTTGDVIGAGFNLLAAPLKGAVAALTDPVINYLSEQDTAQELDSAFNSILEMTGQDADDFTHLAPAKKLVMMKSFISTSPKMQEIMAANPDSDIDSLIAYIGTNPGGNWTTGPATSEDDLTIEGYNDYLADTPLSQQAKDVVDGVATLVTGGGAAKLFQKGKKTVKNIKAKKNLKDEKVAEVKKARKEAHDIKEARLDLDMEKLNNNWNALYKAKKGMMSDRDVKILDKINAQMDKIADTKTKNARNLAIKELEDMKALDKEFAPGIISTILSWIF